VHKYFVDDNVLQRPADFTLGNTPRALSSVRTPWTFTTNLSLGKQFALRESMNIEFRIEAQNALNHPIFSTPNTTVGDENFGQITSTSGLIGPREIQLGMKFNF